jgi:uncharacterized membrane protein YdjX (TVP38/TMEM64 family)
MAVIRSKAGPRRWLSVTSSAQPSELDRAVADDGWQVVVLMRLSPIVPFNLQNYALGVTAIPFLQYFTATLIDL